MLLLIALSLVGVFLMMTGCTIRLPRSLFSDDGYTAAEVDAINARMQCKAQARTMIEINRCETR